MSIEGWYYLHSNGALIYKPDHDGTVADIRDSNFARGLWPMDPDFARKIVRRWNKGIK